MNLLVFAHKPPPHHGQSFMIQLLLDALRDEGGAPVPTKPGHPSSVDGVKSSPESIRCFHVDARFSSGIEDIGRARWGKLFLLGKYIAQALWYRFYHRADCFYYVPANANRTPVVRDWMILCLCRPFFRKTIFHWHTTGLGDWVEKETKPWERRLCHWAYGRPDLSIVLRPYNRRDATYFHSQRIEIVPNGVPDPCPDYDAALRPRREARATVRKKRLQGLVPDPAEIVAAGEAAEDFRILFLSLCLREKGLFDTVEAVALLQRELKGKGAPVRLHLTVAGTFWDEEERKAFDRRILEPDLHDGTRGMVNYLGFVSGDEKRRLFQTSDCLCFPTYYAAESFGLALVEALSYGLPVVASRWRDLPELLPAGYPGIVDIKAPDQIARALRAWMGRDADGRERVHYVQHYTVEKFSDRMKEVLSGV